MTVSTLKANACGVNIAVRIPVSISCSRLGSRCMQSAGAYRFGRASVVNPPATGRRVVVASAVDDDKAETPAPAGGQEMDFDAYLALWAEKFEASEKKGVITAYAIGGILAFLFSEYLIHIPVFDVLLGFPIQLLGLIMTPYLGVRYLVDKKDFVEDTGKAFKTVTDKLPGLK